MTNVNESFENLCSVTKGLKNKDDNFEVSIQSGASSDDIEHCEVKNGWQFPDELKEFLTKMNGEVEDPTIASLFFAGGVKFCALSKMEQVHKTFLGIESYLVNYTPGEFARVDSNQFIPQDKAWQRYWIPLAAEQGCQTVLFLDPKPENTSDEAVIFWSYEDRNCGPPIATSVSGLFDSIADYVVNNKWVPTITKLPPVEPIPY